MQHLCHCKKKPRNKRQTFFVFLFLMKSENENGIDFEFSSRGIDLQIGVSFLPVYDSEEFS